MVWIFFILNFFIKNLFFKKFARALEFKNVPKKIKPNHIARSNSLLCWPIFSINSANPNLMYLEKYLKFIQNFLIIFEDFIFHKKFFSIIDFDDREFSYKLYLNVYGYKDILKFSNYLFFKKNFFFKKHIFDLYLDFIESRNIKLICIFDYSAIKNNYLRIHYVDAIKCGLMWQNRDEIYLDYFFFLKKSFFPEYRLYLYTIFFKVSSFGFLKRKYDYKIFFLKKISKII